MKKLSLMASLFCMPIFCMESRIQHLEQVQTDLAVTKTILAARISAEPYSAPVFNNPLNIFYGIKMAMGIIDGIGNAFRDMSLANARSRAQEYNAKLEFCEKQSKILMGTHPDDEEDQWRKLLDFQIENHLGDQRLVRQQLTQCIERNRLQNEAIMIIEHLGPKPLLNLATEDDYFKEKYKQKYPKDYELWFGKKLHVSKSLPDLSKLSNN